MKYLLVLLLLIAVPVYASPQAPARKSCKKCPPVEQCPPSHHCTEPAGPPAPVVIPAESEYSEIQKGFEVVAGFRWDRKLECPTAEEPKPEPSYPDPIFIGLQQRLSLSESLTLQARVDRDLFDDSGDFLQASHWNAAVSLHWAPWR